MFLSKQIFIPIAAIAIVACSSQSFVKQSQNASSNSKKLQLSQSSSLKRNTSVLDSYRHKIKLPARSMPIAISLDIDKPYLLNEGDNAIMQVGVATSQPTIARKTLHFLIFRPDVKNIEANRNIENFAHELHNNNKLKNHITIDWSRDSLNKVINTPSLLTHKDSSQLDEFLRRYIKGFKKYNIKHFILVVGGYGTLTETAQQNVNDMAKYLTTKGSSLSVLTLNSNSAPNYLKSIAENGHGLFSTHKITFSLTNWIKQEISYISANKVSRIKVQIDLNEAVKVTDTVSGPEIEVKDSHFSYELPDIKQGEHRISIFKLSVPSLSKRALEKQGLNRKAILDKKSRMIIANAKISAFDTKTNQYYTDTSQLTVNFSNDLNEVLKHRNYSIDRSMLILETIDILKKSALYVKDKRPYSAMALMSEQKTKLLQLGYRLDDDALLYDAETLEKYENKLYQYADKIAQSLKGWKDIVSEKDRFNTASTL